MVLRRAVNLLTLSTSLTVELSSLSSLWDFTRLERWSTSPHILGHVLLHSTHLPSCPVASPEPCQNHRAVIMQVMQTAVIVSPGSLPCQTRSPPRASTASTLQEKEGVHIVRQLRVRVQLSENQHIVFSRMCFLSSWPSRPHLKRSSEPLMLAKHFFLVELLQCCNEEHLASVFVERPKVDEQALHGSPIPCASCPSWVGVPAWRASP